jgi:hypothetical protein
MEVHAAIRYFPGGFNAKKKRAIRRDEDQEEGRL